MSINLSSLAVTADLGEKDPDRVQLIQEFIESGNGYFERAQLKECSKRKEGLDYLIEGEFNYKSIDLAIEFKTFADFSGTWQTLEDRLPRALLAHRHVALIIEMGTPDLTDLETTNCRFINPAVPDGSANVLTLATFEAKCDEWTNQGIHVRIIQNKLQLTTTILNLLYFVSKEHTGLWLSSPDYKTQLINWMSHIPIKGVGYAVAQKLAAQFGNAQNIMTMSETDLQECVGMVTGTKLYYFFRDTSYKTLPNNQVKLLEKVPDLDKELSQPIIQGKDQPTEKKQSKPKVNVPIPKENPPDNKITIQDNSPKGIDFKELLKKEFPEHLQSSSAISDRSHTIASSSASLPDVCTPDKNSMSYLDEVVFKEAPPIKKLTLEQKIIHEVKASLHPYSDNECLRFIMVEERLEMPAAHKLMKEIINPLSHQLFLSQGIITFCGVKAEPELDCGV